MPQSGDRGRATGEVQAGDVVEQAAKPVRLLARVGLVAYGLIHLVVAALIVQVAFGDHERADKKGALQEIAESGSGRLLLWVVVAGWPRSSCCGSSTRCPRTGGWTGGGGSAG